MAETDEERLKLIVEQIAEFGQTPHQLFSIPHPQRDIQKYKLPELTVIFFHF